MNKTNLVIFDQIMSNLAELKETKAYFSSPKDFTRDRVFTFLTMFFLISNLPRKSLNVEIQEGLEMINPHLGKKVMGSKSGFCKARKKIKPELFEKINSNLINHSYEMRKNKLKKWNDFFLTAIDGSILDLVDTVPVRTLFGSQKNQHGSVPQGRMMIGFDVLNNLIINSSLGGLSVGETNVAKTWLSAMGKDRLCIYDRLFPGSTLQYLHQKYEIPYVMRCKLGHNNRVKAFVKSKKKQKVEDWNLSQTSLTQIRNLGFKVSDKDTVRVRMVRIELDNGEVEILLTNLFDVQKFSLKSLKEVYNLRWGVETGIEFLKNTLQIEISSGQTVQSIYQDFFATIFRANVQALIEMDCEEKVKEKNQSRELTYKINRTAAAGLLKRKISLLFLSDNPRKAYQLLIDLFIRNLEPIREGRSFPRIKKSIKLNGKYRPMKNYKRIA